MPKRTLVVSSCLSHGSNPTFSFSSHPSWAREKTKGSLHKACAPLCGDTGELTMRNHPCNLSWRYRRRLRNLTPSHPVIFALITKSRNLCRNLSLRYRRRLLNPTPSRPVIFALVTKSRNLCHNLSWRYRQRLHNLTPKSPCNLCPHHQVPNLCCNLHCSLLNNAILQELFNE